MLKAYKLFAGPDGHSYVQEGAVQEDLFIQAVSLRFKETPPLSEYDWHPAPTTQYVLTLTGTLEFTTSLGKVFVLKAGEVLIAMDTTGMGHKWRMLGSEPWKRAYVLFDEGTALNFVPYH